MKKLKNGLILLLLIILPLLLLYCSEGYKEPVPFFDGLYLEYSFDGIPTIYNVKVIDNNKFRIIETRKWSSLSDEVEELFVNAHGKVYKSTFKDYEGKFSPIWIPAYAMKIGDTFDEGYQVVRKDKWKKWNVMVVKSPGTLGETELYYESKTGFLVGFFARMGTREGTEILENTNANIPVVE
jgi:hypothetical protein